MSDTPYRDEVHMRDLQLARDKLPIAQLVAPETTGIMIDADGGWFGHRDGMPTTTIVEGDELPERLD